MTTITIGDRVKWAVPMEAGDDVARYEVVEVNGDRCIVRFICDLPIAPTTLAKVADLTVA